MKHATLYRRWRPRRFGQIVGQEPVVRTLRRAIETGRVSHAYLFSGPRGTGKTSTAKVLAMGLNCEKGPTPEPCGECGSCRAIINNSSMDVLEMDAASNRGIDEIRELRDRVNLAPAAGRMKVYIIDEVHMLTAEAFNALLKMLEEPPEHVVFVLATTEKHKVLPTIISRCQSFDFRRPGVETLAGKLAEIAGAEGIEAEPEALTVIARAGGGSFRDAEGLLDQLASFSEGRITASMVRELLGSVGPGTLIETVYALHERRAADALRIVDRLSNEGRDLGQFLGELVSHLRVLMLLPHAPEVALAEVGAGERAPLEEQAERVPTTEVVRMIEALGDAMGRMKRGGDPKMELELTFLKLARDYAGPSTDALMSRIEALEKAVAGGTVPVEAPAKPQEPVPERPEGAPPLADGEDFRVGDVEAGGGEPEGGKPAGGENGLPDIAGQWGALMQDLKDQRQAPAAAVYEEARVAGFDGKVLELTFPEELSIYARLAQDERHAKPLQEALERRFGVRPRLECRVADGRSSRADTAPAEEASLQQAPPRAEPEDALPPANVGREEEAPSRAEPGPDEVPRGNAKPDGSSNADLGAQASGRPAGAGESDGAIRDEREVFALARERSGRRGGGGR